MSDIAKALNDLLNAIGCGESENICAWCGREHEHGDNFTVKSVPRWSFNINDNEPIGFFYLCTYCRRACRKAHIGEMVTNPEHPHYGRQIDRMLSHFITRKTLLQFWGSEEETKYAEVLAKRMKIRADLEEKKNKAKSKAA